MSNALFWAVEQLNLENADRAALLEANRRAEGTTSRQRGPEVLIRKFVQSTSHPVEHRGPETISLYGPVLRHFFLSIVTSW